MSKTQQLYKVFLLHHTAAGTEEKGLFTKEEKPFFTDNEDTAFYHYEKELDFIRYRSHKNVNFHLDMTVEQVKEKYGEAWNGVVAKLSDGKDYSSICTSVPISIVEDEGSSCLTSEKQ